MALRSRNEKIVFQNQKSSFVQDNTILSLDFALQDFYQRGHGKSQPVQRL